MALIRGFASAMSQVISFRLNKGNPREARAIEILEARSMEGYCIRYIITEALLRLDDSESESITIALNDLNTALNQVSKLIKHFDSESNIAIVNSDESQKYTGLTHHFVASLKESVKPGIKSG